MQLATHSEYNFNISTSKCFLFSSQSMWSLESRFCRGGGEGGGGRGRGRGGRGRGRGGRGSGDGGRREGKPSLVLKGQQDIWRSYTAVNTIIVVSL